MTIMIIFPALVTFIVGYMLIKYPVVISMPTDRGMHKDRVASSGGIALIIGWAIMLGIGIESFIPLLLIGLLGFLDDKYSLSKFIRFGAQIGVSGYFVIDMSSAYIYNLNFISLFMLVFISTYTINIYNFMDGIDQLAISQAIFIFFGVMLLHDFANLSLFLIFIAFFLINYPKTKLFLGNSGSYFLGFLMTFLIIQGIMYSGENYSVIPILILMTAFYVDTTYTLIVRFIRIFNDENSSLINSVKYITEAHRTHSYQKVAIKKNSHSKSVFIIMAYNIIWCLPLAYLAVIYSEYNLFCLLISYLPYTLYCYKNKAGIEA